MANSSQIPDPEHNQLMQTIDDINTGKRVLRTPEDAGELPFWNPELDKLIEGLQAWLALYNGQMSPQDKPNCSPTNFKIAVNKLIAAERTKLLENSFKTFFDTFQKEIDEQEFAIDEAEWMSLTQAMRIAESVAKHKEGLKQ